MGDAGGRATRRAIAALVLTVLAATSLHASRGLRPVRLRLEGYFGAALEGRPGIPRSRSVSASGIGCSR